MTKQSIFRIASIFLIFTFFLTLLVQPSGKVFADTDHCGSIASNETWGTVGNVHTISCDVTVAAGATLTIAPGVIIKFENDTSLFIDGKIEALGIIGNPLYFTSVEDDSLGGDTNGDGASVGNVEDWGHIQFNSGSDDTSIIENAEIRFSGNTGCCSSTRIGAIVFDNASPIINNITFVENYLNGIEVLAGAWDSDIWNNIDVVYFSRNPLIIPGGNTLTLATGLQTVFFEDVSVSSGGTLVIQPDVIVKFSNDDSLFIDGRIEAIGTTGNPIYFTAEADDTIGGDGNGDGASVGQSEDWGHIQFNAGSDDSSIISNAEVRFSGNTGCCSSTRIGAIVFENASPILQNITFADNFLDGVEPLAGAWDTDVWNNTDVVYYVRNELIVPATNSLTLASGQRVHFLADVTVVQNGTLLMEAGAIAKFGDDDSLIIDGKLEASGTLANPIYFTSENDDSIGGDSNGDGASVGAVEDWGNIQFGASSDDSSIIEYGIIRFGGSITCCSAGDVGVISIENTSPTIRFSQIADSYRGIELLSGATPSLTCNDIFDTTSFGIFNDTPSLPVAAQAHWWGHPSGPAHAGNPGGLGESVSDGVIYTPWASTSCFVEQPVFDNFIYLPMIIK